MSICDHILLVAGLLTVTTIIPLGLAFLFMNLYSRISELGTVVAAWTQKLSEQFPDSDEESETKGGGDA